MTWSCRPATLSAGAELRVADVSTLLVESLE
jgi:hypothetical protein